MNYAALFLVSGPGGVGGSEGRPRASSPCYVNDRPQPTNQPTRLLKTWNLVLDLERPWCTRKHDAKRYIGRRYNMYVGKCCCWSSGGVCWQPNQLRNRLNSSLFAVLSRECRLNVDRGLDERDAGRGKMHLGRAEWAPRRGNNQPVSQSGTQRRMHYPIYGAISCIFKCRPEKAILQFASQRPPMHPKVAVPERESATSI